MVRARASLAHTLDAATDQPGSQFHATLNDTVHLDSGVVLHSGDTLLGKVVTDDMNTTGKSRLAVRFTEATLKNGQTVPIKATIVGLYRPGELTNNADDLSEQIPNTWNDGTLDLDEVNVVKDVDLHSRIASSDSGVFVSTKKNDVKIPGGSEIALAIEAGGNAGPTNSGL
jgi:hypothetical protein